MGDRSHPHRAPRRRVPLIFRAFTGPQWEALKVSADQRSVHGIARTTQQDMLDYGWMDDQLVLCFEIKIWW